MTEPKLTKAQIKALEEMRDGKFEFGRGKAVMLDKLKRRGLWDNGVYGCVLTPLGRASLALHSAPATNASPPEPSAPAGDVADTTRSEVLPARPAMPTMQGFQMGDTVQYGAVQGVIVDIFKDGTCLVEYVTDTTTYRVPLSECVKVATTLDATAAPATEAATRRCSMDELHDIDDFKMPTKLSGEVGWYDGRYDREAGIAILQVVPLFTKTVVYYPQNNEVALIIDAETLEIVGVQIEDYDPR